MTENKRFTLRLTHKDNGVKIFDNLDENNWRILALNYVDYEDTKYTKAKLEPVVDLLNVLNDGDEELKLQYKELEISLLNNQLAYNDLEKENEELKNKIDALEDDNETYHKSLEKLNLYTKRFIPTNCINEFKDCKTNRYYWLDHEGNFEGCLELLNLLDCEREVLESENRQLKAKLMEYEEQIKGDYE